MCPLGSATIVDGVRGHTCRVLPTPSPSAQGPPRHKVEPSGPRLPFLAAPDAIPPNTAAVPVPIAAAQPRCRPQPPPSGPGPPLPDLRPSPHDPAAREHRCHVPPHSQGQLARPEGRPPSSARRKVHAPPPSPAAATVGLATHGPCHGTQPSSRPTQGPCMPAAHLGGRRFCKCRPCARTACARASQCRPQRTH